jgi:hypothetical protein
MKILFIILQLPLWIFSKPPDSVPVPGTYKIKKSYIIQEVCMNCVPPEFPVFTGLSRIWSFYGEYYVASKNQIIKSLRKNIIELDKLQTIIEPSDHVYTLNEKGEYQSIGTVTYSFYGISNVLALSETQIYKIGDKYYILRRLKYAYIDNIKLKYEDFDDGLQDYKKDYIGLYLFNIELLPTHSSIKKYIWKRKYELPDFWKENILRIYRKQVNELKQQ